MTVRTVLGDIAASELGVTHSHEHLVAHATPELVATDSDLALDDPSRVALDLAAFREAGGRAIAEMTTIDYGRDAAALRQLSAETGIHIIAATGFNKGTYCRPYTEGKSVDAVADQMLSEVLEGIDGTAVKAGMIKFGTSLNVIHPWEEVAGRAAARAHRRTGALIVTHTEAGTMAREQLALLAGEGVSPDRVMLCHLDRNPDLALHLELARRGAFLSYDQIPKPKYRTEDSSIAMVLALAREGLHGQIMLGGDFARRQYFTGWGGAPGLAYLTTAFAAKLGSALAKAGFQPEPILRDLLVNNPARAFAIRPV
jgi:predicted metal-dependent phosphotriesterase family hydrolase